MDRPSYLTKYFFNWELFDVILSGRSALDSHTFLASLNSADQVEDYLKAYGFDPSNPILKAELFGYFQESLQFIKRYFLKEGHSEGLDLTIPPAFFSLSDISELFYMASGNISEKSMEEALWAGVILKVMHTILHADKELRSNYFGVIQQQIFDRFYKFIYRNKNDELFLGLKSDEENSIPLVDFQTKSKKTRDSIILKMLHKPENVAEELFDRVGVRFITKSKLETLQVIKFLHDKHIIMAHNIKPSRSLNTIIDLKKFKSSHHDVFKMTLKNNLAEDRFCQALDREIESPGESEEDGLDEKNQHTSNSYKSIQFTCRQLIIYQNPLVKELSNLKKEAREIEEDGTLKQKISDLDLSLISRDVRFFYPFEVQIQDKDSYEANTVGEASHQEYKKSQRTSAMNRVFKDLMVFQK